MTGPAVREANPGPPTAPVIAFGVLAALGAAVFASSFGYGLLGEDARVGPGLLPMVTGLLLLLLSAGQLLARVLRGRAGTPDPAPTADGTVPDASGHTEPQRVRRLWTVVVALPVTVLLVPLLGFLVAFGLLVLFVAALVERRPPLVALLVTALVVAFGYGVFAVFLDVPLPTGLLGDLLGW